VTITLEDVKAAVKKEVVFEEVDDYEVDWEDVSSIVGYLDRYVV
jgi:hypothetical protein